jgi:hypothetical protein
VLDVLEELELTLEDELLTEDELELTLEDELLTEDELEDELLTEDELQELMIPPLPDWLSHVVRPIQLMLFSQPQPLD